MARRPARASSCGPLRDPPRGSRRARAFLAGIAATTFPLFAFALFALADAEDAPLPAATVQGVLRTGEEEGPRLVAALGRRVLPALAELLADPSATVRRRTLLALGRMGPRAVPTASLLARLEDPAPSVRWAAAAALGHSGDAAAIEPLADAVVRAPTDPDLVEAATAALGRLAMPEAAAALLRCIARPGHEGVQRDAAAALFDAAQRGAVPPESGAPEPPWEPTTLRGIAALGARLLAGAATREADLLRILASLDAQDDAIRTISAMVLERAGADGARIVLASWDDLSTRARRPVLRLLASSGAGPGRQLVLAALDDPGLGEAAVLALSVLDDREALAGLARALEPAPGFPSLALRRRGDAAAAALAARGPAALETARRSSERPDPRTRFWAVMALGEMADFGHPGATDALAARIRDDDSRVRLAAARALGTSSHETALRALIEASSDDDPETRIAAVTALGRLARPAALPRLLYLREDPDERVALAALRALGRLVAMPPVAEVLAEVLRISRVAPRRLAAAQALASSDAPTALRPLVEALEDVDAEVRETALGGLARRADPRTWPALVHLAVTEEDPAVRALALAALLGGDPSLVAQDLEEALERGMPEERRRAREVLDRLAGARVARLAAGLGAADAAGRAEAARSLGRLGDRRALPFLERALDDPDPGVVQAALEALTRLTSGTPPR